MTTSSVMRSAAPAAAPPSNGDYDLTPVSETTYTVVDLTNWGRNIFTVVKDGLIITRNGLNVVTKVAGVAGTVLFVGTIAAGSALIATGAVSFYAAHKWTIPKAKKDLSTAETQLAHLQQKTDAVAQRVVPVDPLLDPLLTKAHVDAQKAVKIAKSNLKGNQLFRAMGGAAVANGAASITGILLPGVVTLVGEVGTGVALGGIYVVRGGYIYHRASESLKIVREFQEKFNTEGAKEPLKALEVMEEAEYLDKLNPGYLSRRVNSSCLKAEDGWVYGATSKQQQRVVKDDEGDVILEETIHYADEPKEQCKIDQLEYLIRVDKGIYTEELKQKVSRIIAVAMLLGGIFTIVASILLIGMLGPFAPLVVGLAAAVFFVVMEGVFATYDSSTYFTRFRDRYYEGTKTWCDLRHSKPQWVRDAIAELQSLKEAKQAPESWMNENNDHEDEADFEVRRGHDFSGLEPTPEDLERLLAPKGR